MADDETPDEIDDAELDVDLDEEDPVDDDVIAVVVDDEVEDDEDDDADDAPAKPRKAGDEEDDDEPDPDDVEADLDTILKDRLANEDDEDEEEEETTTGKATAKTVEGGKVIPRQEDEFVCTSCFLVKPATQLADAKNKLCNDCV